MNRVEFLLLSQFIIFLLGWPLEWTEIIIIFVPIFLPLLKFFGVNPNRFDRSKFVFYRSKSGKERLVRERARFGDVVRILGNFIRSPIL